MAIGRSSRRSVTRYTKICPIDN